MRQKKHKPEEIVAKAVQERIVTVGSKAAFIEPGSPWKTDAGTASTPRFVTSF